MNGKCDECLGSRVVWSPRTVWVLDLCFTQLVIRLLLFWCDDLFIVFATRLFRQSNSRSTISSRCFAAMVKSTRINSQPSIECIFKCECSAPHTGMHAVSSERHQLWLGLGERQFGIGQRANIREFQRNHWESSNESTGIATYKPQWSSNRWIVWSRYLSHKIKSVVNLTPFHCTVYMTNLNLFILAPQMIAHKWAYEKKIYWVMQRKRKERRKNENSYFASTVTA